jgi:hypothetical protein
LTSVCGWTPTGGGLSIHYHLDIHPHNFTHRRENVLAFYPISCADYMCVVLVPETYVPYILKRKAAKSLLLDCFLSFFFHVQVFFRLTGDVRYWVPLDQRPQTLFRVILVNCYVPFGELKSSFSSELLIVDQMALLLDL